jgi:hypothetical protein
MGEIYSLNTLIMLELGLPYNICTRMCGRSCFHLLAELSSIKPDIRKFCQNLLMHSDFG